MRRLAVVVATVATVLVGLASAVGCGNGIGGSELPELRVEDNEIELSEMNPNGSRSQTQLQLENDGDGEMEVRSIEWLDQPGRVEAYHRSDDLAGESCSSSDDCPGDSLCLTQANDCVEPGFRDLSGSYARGSTFDQSLMITDEDGPVECPQPPEGEDVPVNYCGAIEVETNASNDGENVEDGNVTFYIVSDGSSGIFALSDTWIEFTFAAFGATQTKQFDIINEAEAPLEIDDMHVDAVPHWFEFIPENPDVEFVNDLVVEGNSSETITIEMTPPPLDDLDEDEEEEMEIEEQVGVTFESSSIDVEQALTIDVTSGPGNVPVIDVEPQQLSFDENPVQTLSVFNHGEATLSVRNMDVRPTSPPVQDAYSVTHNGQQMLESDPDSVTIPASDGEEPTVEEFDVELVDPDAAETLIGELRVHHNDEISESPLSVALLGDAGDVAVGEVAPSTTDMRANDSQERYLVVSNSGNADLEIDELDISPGSTTDVDSYEFETYPQGEPVEDVVVAPGALQQLRVSYEGDADEEMDQDLDVDVVSNHAGVSSAMHFNIRNRRIDSTTEMDISIAPGFPDTALVGEQTSFAVVDDAEVGRIDYASWYLLDRPEGSEAVLEGAGEQSTFVPDVAGDYRISVVVDEGSGFSSEVQKIFEFEAVE